VERPHVDQAGAHGEGVGDEEMAEVTAHDAFVDGHVDGPAPAPGEDHHGRRRDDHGEAGEHERRAEDGADAHVVGGRAAGEDDGDDWHQSLGQGGTDGGEDAAHGPLS